MGGFKGQTHLCLSCAVSPVHIPNTLPLHTSTQPLLFSPPTNLTSPNVQEDAAE